MRSGDFLLRFEMAVMAKPMNDGCALAAEAASTEGTSGAAIAATRGSSSSAGSIWFSGRLLGAGITSNRERACRVSRFSDDAHAIETTSYAAKSRSCPLSMGSGDFFLRFETAVMAKPMNDGWALAVEAAAAGGTSARHSCNQKWFFLGGHFHRISG